MKKIKIPKYKPTDTEKLRTKYLKKGIELVNISTLCEYRLGISGSCNDYNEPDESIHHVQIWYRDENIGVINGNSCYSIDENEYIIYVVKSKYVNEDNFIIYKLAYRGRKK